MIEECDKANLKTPDFYVVDEFFTSTFYLSDQVRKLILNLKDETLDFKDLMGRAGLQHRTFFVRNYINPAIAPEIVETTIADKPQSRF